MPDCDVLILADYFCDIVITGLPEPPRLGADLFGEGMDIVPGGAYILATAMHRLGVRARWMARWISSRRRAFPQTARWQGN